MKPSKGQKRIVLQDIANATGYTVNTVSRALQNKPDIAKDTCLYIQKVANEMGYVRNTIASSLRLGHSRMLAVIVGEASNPFYAIMIDAIHDYAEEIGYTVMVFCSRDTAEQEQRAILTAIGRQVDGILLFPCPQAEESIRILQQSGIPFVLVSRHMEKPDYDYVVCDEETGGYLAARHLLEAGHRKLAFYYTKNVAFSTEQRISGMLRATRENRIPDENVDVYQNLDDAKTLEQLKHWKAEGVTGIFVFCDIEAWRLSSIISSCDMSDDFSLMGFDNIQSMISFPSPLCTVDGAMWDLSRTAFNILIGRINGDAAAPHQKVFPVHIVCRGSCAKSNLGN